MKKICFIFLICIFIFTGCKQEVITECKLEQIENDLVEWNQSLEKATADLTSDEINEKFSDLCESTKKDLNIEFDDHITIRAKVHDIYELDGLVFISISSVKTEDYNETENVLLFCYFKNESNLTKLKIDENVVVKGILESPTVLSDCSIISPNLEER